ncbi:MAG: glycosyltransferase family 4 protein, partial [Gaiellales bacterium]
SGRSRLVEELRLSPGRIRVIPHPVFPSRVRREDDGRTVLFLGVIRPYKQIDHAIGAAREAGCRLLVVGDPVVELGSRLGLPHVEWRLGYRPHAEIDDALAESTLAIFTHRNELDQSGALLRALGAGVPAVAYDVGGIAEPVRTYGAGAVVPADDREALAAAIERILTRPRELARARAGALRAREELNWAAAARAHLDVYGELV